jgi:hypothetical protein
LLPLFCGWLYSWLFHLSYISYGKNLMARILDFAIKILMIGGFFGLLLGLSLVIELLLIR